jgi:hypothetical protein
MTFGYGTKEFEVTSERLGCYRPEDHIDNPKDYADNLDAREYDPRLRGPVNERVELAIDPRRGLKNYIASEEVGIMTSAAHVRKLFKKCIELGRNYGRSKREADLYEALRLMGTGLHCLEGVSSDILTLLDSILLSYVSTNYAATDIEAQTSALILTIRNSHLLKWESVMSSPSLAGRHRYGFPGFNTLSTQ